jgi:uncharacterized membrane protein
MVYKKIAIIYIGLLALIFSLSFMRANRSMIQPTQLALFQGSSLIVMIALIIIVIILVATFILSRFFAKKRLAPVQEQKPI